jgi:hypothetical protein
MINFSKTPKNQISWKSIAWSSSCYMQAERLRNVKSYHMQLYNFSLWMNLKILANLHKISINIMYLDIIHHLVFI